VSSVTKPVELGAELLPSVEQPTVRHLAITDKRNSRFEWKCPLIRAPNVGHHASRAPPKPLL
jgi:hypothetical protein